MRFWGDWLLYHPALDWWSPFQLVFTQEGKDATGASAGFGNEPVCFLAH